MVVEDVHWADPSTLELLELLAADVRDCAALVVATTRPDATHPLRGATQTVALDRLDPDESAHLARAVAGDDVDRDLIEMVVARAEGLPFFIEELALLARESSAHGGTVDTDRIPSTLLASLTTRLDQLGDVKPLAQVAAVIGREVPVDLLVRAAALEAPDATAAVDRLVASGLME
jgi:predicted ATPase